MSSKKCGRCEKTVYPTEELKCLDKVWHKLCFKCKECGMSLNMRNYKGFNKEPYCEAHIPKAKATTMAETPELKRIAENTKIQSNVKYHADFERSKGKFTQVADDPETLRIKQNTKIISNVAYHGELQRKAEMEQRRQLNENGGGGGSSSSSSSSSNSTSTSTTTTLITTTDVKNANQTLTTPPYQQPPLPPPPPPPPPPTTTTTTALHHNETATITTNSNNHNIGKISDYEQPPLLVALSNQYDHHHHQSPYSARNSQTLIYSSDIGVVNQQPQRHIGSVHDLDPVNHNYGSLGRVYRAMYDYQAQDDDEVSFQDGDLIVNVRSIDGGWMTGEVQRTGQVGMLPANYVQLVNI